MSMHKKVLINFILAILLALPVTAHTATYYRWVDDQNVTHYTTHPPEDRASEKVNIYGSKKSTATPATQITEPTPANADQQAANSPDQANTKPKKDPKVCARARENLKTLQENAQIRQRNEYGEDYILSEEQKAQEIEKAKEAIKKNC